MSQRIVVKRIVQFGKREFNEKKPKHLKVLRVKSHSILKRGILPNLQIKQIGIIHYVIIADYGEYLRSYLFTKDGELLGGEKMEKNRENIKKIEKSTDLIYKLPKSKPQLSLSHITRNYREEFEKKLERINHTFGLSLEIPLVIVADKNLHVKINRNIGAKRDKESLKITHKAYKKSLFNIVSYREIFYNLLTNFIKTVEKESEYEQFYYDLSLLLTNFYLGNQNRSTIVKLFKNSQQSKNLLPDKHYNPTKHIINILSNEYGSFSQAEIYLIFQNLIKILTILRKYRILFRSSEIFLFTKQFISLFSLKNFKSLKSAQDKGWHHRFFYDCYSIISAENEKPVQEKSNFITIAFGLLGNLSAEKLNHIDFKSNFQGMIDLLSSFTKYQIIQNEIINNKLLISDALTHYAFNKILKVIYQTEIKKNKISFSLKINNTSNYIFKDFTYDLIWKPKSRVSLIEKDDKKKSIDLHNFLERNYELLAENPGKISFFLLIKFRNFINPNAFSEKKIKMTKVFINE